MKLDIVFEDKNILVVNKPAGLVVNRSETYREDTLQDMLVDYFKLENLGIGDRAGIVHRLDRETSGLLVIAKVQGVFEFLQSQFKERKVKKEYLALVHGEVLDEFGSISGEIGRIGKFGKFGVLADGRASVTDYFVEKKYVFVEKKFENILDKSAITKSRVNYLKAHAKKYTFLKMQPKTGRTHQIRVHLKNIGHPVVSDSIYTPSKLLKFDSSWCPRLFLHATNLEFKILKTKPMVKLKSALPKGLKNAMLNLLEIRN